MSLNQFMHPRNPFYNNPPDFSKLAQAYPEFSKYCKFDKKQKCTIDFKDPEALKFLCQVLLKNLFGLTIEIPTNHLIPRVPQRINYVLWLEDLLGKPKNAIGIDIGCGTCSIYGIISCSLNKDWKIIGSDISSENIEWSLKNISLNNLENKIFAIKVENKSILLELISKIDQDINNPAYLLDIDFVMCNPPFFSNENEHLGKSNSRKPDQRSSPNSLNTALLYESVYGQGGEVAFIKQMIEESTIINKRIKIYTTMFGKKSSLLEIKKYLIEKKILNVSETQFCQGHTMRWGIAWSFLEEKIKIYSYKKEKEEELKNSKKIQDKKPLKFAMDKSIPELEYKYNKETVYEQIREFFIKELKFDIQNENKTKGKLVYVVREKTWTNRKERRDNLIHGISNDIKKLEEKFSFNCSIDIRNDLIEVKLNLVQYYDQNEFKIFKNYLNEIFEFSKNFWKKKKK